MHWMLTSNLGYLDRKDKRTGRRLNNRDNNNRSKGNHHSMKVDRDIKFGRWPRTVNKETNDG